MVEGPTLLCGDGGDVSYWDDDNIPRIVISCSTRPDEGRAEVLSVTASAVVSKSGSLQP